MFDFDGVIADSLAAYYPVFAATCKELGFSGPATLDAFLDVFDTNAVKGLRRAGVPFYKLRKLGRCLAPRVAELNRNVSPFPEMTPLLNHLAARHPVYVVTSNMTDTARSFLDTHGVAGLQGVIGADIKASKVRKIRRIRKRHPGVSSWYVGDTKGDMVEGRAAGATTVAVTWGWHDRARLQSGQPNHMVDSVKALARLLDGE